MAEYEERSLDDLTEEPSQHRLDELRSQGVVAQSRELTGTLGLVGVVLMLYFVTNGFFLEVSEFMKEIFTTSILQRFDAHDWKAFSEILSHSGRIMAKAVLPIGIGGMILGVLTAVAQVGFHVSTEALSPDFERVNPIKGIMNLMSLKSMVDGAKALVKFSVLAGAVYFAIHSQIAMMPNVVTFEVKRVLEYMGSITGRMMAVVIGFLILLAGADYWLQWFRFQKQARMTKAEAKKEMKEREGDPQIKARIRTIQRDAARKRMMRSVPKADVIITNPTHIAIAVAYNPHDNVAPRVLAKGADYLAERIKQIARENGIPTVENKPLARTLYKHVKVGQMIPRSLYQAVAEILAYVYRLKGKRMGSGDRVST